MTSLGEYLRGEKQLGVVSKYQYLGLLLTEFLHYNEMAKAVARLAGRALSLLIVKSRAHGGFHFDTYTKLYDSLSRHNITSRPVSKNTTPLLNTRRLPTHIPINDVHFRNPSVPRTNEIFLLGEKQLGVVSKYQYLGLLLTEFLDYKNILILLEENKII
jgi:hypothetical protein